MSNNSAFRPTGRPTVLAFYSLHPLPPPARPPSPCCVYDDLGIRAGEPRGITRGGRTPPIYRAARGIGIDRVPFNRDAPQIAIAKTTARTSRWRRPGSRGRQIATAYRRVLVSTIRRCDDSRRLATTR